MTTEATLYEPPGSIELSDANNSLFRVGIQGYPKTGKTWSSLTFPNPHVVNWDNNLRGFQEVYPDKKITQSPMWDHEWVKKYLVSPNGFSGVELFKDNYFNARDAALWWLKTHGPKFTSAQTIIWDSWTTYQSLFDAQYIANPMMTSKGEVDNRSFYMQKGRFAEQVLSLLKELKCHVVVLFHEQQEKDKEGHLTGRIKIMMDGKSADKLAVYFTDWFRQIALDEEIKDSKGNITGRTTKHYWQVNSDVLCACGTSVRKLDTKKIVQGRILVPATYESLI